jgi:hypothetical protein
LEKQILTIFFIMVRVKNQMAPVLDTDNAETMGSVPETIKTASSTEKDQQYLHSFQEPEIEIKEELEAFEGPELDEQDLPVAKDEIPRRKLIGRPRKSKSSGIIVQDFGSRSRSERTKKAKSIFDPSFDRIKKRRFPNPLESLDSNPHYVMKPKMDNPRPLPRLRSPLSKYPRNTPLSCYVCLNPEGRR